MDPLLENSAIEKIYIFKPLPWSLDAKQMGSKGRIVLLFKQGISKGLVNTKKSITEILPTCTKENRDENLTSYCFVSLF